MASHGGHEAVAAESTKSCSLWLAVFVVLLASVAFAQPQPPELTRPVNDFAGVIDAGSAAQLDSLIRSLQETTGDVIVVATITSLENDDINAYAERMFRNRGKGIGQAGKDNGLLILAAMDERMMKIEVGYDLEQFITDGFAGETRDVMAPFFRRGEYGQGFVAAVTRLIGRIADGRGVTVSGVPRTRPSSPRRDTDSGLNIVGLIVLLVLINVIAGRVRRRRRGRWGGGGWSGWNSGVGPFGGGFGGFGRGGGFGGGFGGFGGGGGGFGGFGGGRSGGGGAGGSW